MIARSDWQSIRRLARLLRPHGVAVALALLSMAAASAGLLGLPILVRGMLEGAAHAQAPAWWQVAAMAGILAVLAAAAYVSSVMLHEVARKACARLRSEYVARWLASSVGEHRSVPAGEYAERLNTCLADIDWFIKGSLGNLLAIFLVMIGGGAMLFWLSWRLALVILLVAPIVVAVLRLVEREGRRLLRLGRAESEKMAGLLQGMVLGLDTVKAFNAEEEALRKFEEKQDGLLAIQRKESFVSSLVEPVLIFAGAVTFLVVVFVAGRLIAAGGMDLPQFVTFLVYLMFVLPNLRNLGMQLARWRHVKVALDFLDDVSRLPEEVDNGCVAAPSAGGSIEFRSVCYRHGERHTGLENVSFSVAPGEHVGIVGESGSGKSTLFALLLQFYRPQSGSILIDGRDLSTFTLPSARRLFSYVPQDIVLFDGTIRDNLRFGIPRVSDEEITRACRASQIWPFVESLPKGLDSQVGDRGLRLSSGQRQRLAVARALLRGAPFFLLDEATSALDPKTERVLGAELRRVLAGHTVFTVVHRLTVIAELPRVIFLDRGVIAGDGTHEQLMARSEAYRSFAGHLGGNGTAPLAVV